MASPARQLVSAPTAKGSPAIAALFGYSAAGALRKKLDLTIPEHLRVAHWRGFEGAITNGVMKLQGCPT
jgi:hypothetical protein